MRLQPTNATGGPRLLLKLCHGKLLTTPGSRSTAQGRISTLQSALSRTEQESDRLAGLLAAAEAAAAAAKSREDAARAAGREYAERARRAETLHEETEAEVAEVRDLSCSCNGAAGHGLLAVYRRSSKQRAQRWIGATGLAYVRLLFAQVRRQLESAQKAASEARADASKLAGELAGRT